MARISVSSLAGIFESNITQKIPRILPPTY